MNSRGTLRTLRSLATLTAALVVAPAALAECPAEEGREAILRSLLADFDVVPSEEKPLDLVSFLPLPSATSDCLLVVGVSEEGDCHACGASVHLAELTATSGGWQTTLKQPRAFEMGAWGRSPEPSLMHSGDRPFALKLSGADMAFGYTSSFVSVVAKVDGWYREVLSLRTGESNCCTGDDEAQWEWQATVEPIEIGSGFPDLRVTYSGTEERDGAIHSAAGTQEFRFDGEEYRLLLPGSPTSGSLPSRGTSEDYDR